MKNYSILSTLLLLTTFSFAQENSTHTCHKRDRVVVTQKSASLSVAQIAETERYNVHFYALDVQMTNLSTDIAGTGEIHGTANEALDSVLFELFETYVISDLRLNGVTTNYSRVGSSIKVPVNITTGTNFEIAIDYAGTPPTGATTPFGGSGMSNGFSGSWGNQVTWSLSEPFSAYEWFPCKQSLTDKADSCAVKVTVPDNCMAGSNGMLENVVNLGNGTKRFEWKHRHAIDYYLISVTIAKYVEYNIFANPAGAPAPILIQNFIYDNPATLINFQSDIDQTVDFMELYSDLYGLYPFHDEKYGHCMAPFSGGMEHQTMTSQGFFTPGLTSHELAHQWWGNNVTCASWADIWVNEGFASYSEYLMYENLDPAETANDMFARHDNVMSQPGGSVWVEDSLNENRIFSGRLTYDKGAAILHTFRFIMNNDNQFFNALQTIQSDYAHSTAYGLDIKAAFETASGIDYTDAFEEWYFGAGYPTYSARWNDIGNDVILEITHTTSSSTPTFTNPLEIRFQRFGQADTTVRVDITANSNQFYLTGMGSVANLVGIDPKNWIINNVGTIQKDENFITAVDQLNLPLDYTIAPNPSNGIFTIETEIPNDHTFIVYDLRGKVIHSGTFTQLLNLDLTSHASGRYIVRLTNDHGEERMKILVKN